ncbi:hypothetical protein PILCRDRAFT_820529, partial [Piloderma croceum F 1598]
MPEVKNQICLIVHDGWSIAPEKGTKGNAIEAGDTTNMDTIAKDHSFAAHGTAVGLSECLMGNSEVGHLNIGAGRIVWQDIKRQFHKSPNIVASMQRAKDGNGRLHLLGLVSDGGVHSHITHLYALLETANEIGVPHTYIRFFGDGRDTAPRSAAGYAKDLIAFVDKEKYGEIATVVGRYYAMDRDKRWERVKIAVDGLVKGEGEKADVVKAIEEKYKENETDEFLKSLIVNGDAGRIKDGDTLFCFNYRSDRMREIASVLGLPDKPIDVEIPNDLVSPASTSPGVLMLIVKLSAHHDHVAAQLRIPFQRGLPQPMTNVFAVWLSKKGVKQAHIAGVEKQFEDEERHLIPSPKVATYDKDPKMSIGVAEKVAEVLKRGDNEFAMCIRPPLIWSIRDTGAPHTAHTTNPVPFIMTGDPKKYKFTVDKNDRDEEPGALCGVAPTMLSLLGLDQPAEMTGRSLLEKIRIDEGKKNPLH